MSAHTGLSDNYDVGATTLFFIVVRCVGQPGHRINLYDINVH